MTCGFGEIKSQKEDGGVTFVSPQHGVCYMFNFGPLYANESPGVNMIDANVFYGLSLDINLESKFWAKK